MKGIKGVEYGSRLFSQRYNKSEVTYVPSESSVLFAFVPKNSQSNVAKLYKGHIKLRMKVTGMNTIVIDLLIDRIVFYAVSAIFLPYNGGDY